jgi:RNA polymerase sigma factor (sigma-70 family)
MTVRRGMESASSGSSDLVDSLRQWSDGRLIDACRDGDQRAWAALIDRYKRLVYSVPVKYGLTADDAADVFQGVCLDLLSGLDSLRQVESLKSWLARVALNRCYHLRKQQRALETTELDDLSEEPSEPGAAVSELMASAEQDQIVRDAVRTLPVRCAKMIHLLFFEDPPLPYTDIARTLGLAPGSIGFIRGRCLSRLEKTLRALGF